MSNFMHEISTSQSHRAIPQLLTAIGDRLGQPSLTRDEYFQIVKDLNGITDELEVLTAVHVVASGEDVLDVAEATGFDDDLVRTCWFVAHPSPSQEQ